MNWFQRIRDHKAAELEVLRHSPKHQGPIARSVANALSDRKQALTDLAHTAIARDKERARADNLQSRLNRIAALETPGASHAARKMAMIARGEEPDPTPRCGEGGRYAPKPRNGAGART